jgi:hypothetical protein
MPGCVITAGTQRAPNTAAWTVIHVGLTSTRTGGCTDAPPCIPVASPWSTPAKACPPQHARTGQRAPRQRRPVPSQTALLHGDQQDHLRSPVLSGVRYAPPPLWSTHEPGKAEGAVEIGGSGRRHWERRENDTSWSDGVMSRDGHWHTLRQTGGVAGERTRRGGEDTDHSTLAAEWVHANLALAPWSRGTGG